MAKIGCEWGRHHPGDDPLEGALVGDWKAGGILGELGYLSEKQAGVV